MLSQRGFRPSYQNRILAALPRAEYERLGPRLEHVGLKPGRVLFEAGGRIDYVYFPTHGMVSLVSTTRDGGCIEVGMIGDEGAAGLPALLRIDSAPYRVIVQLTGAAMRVRARALREEFDRSPQLRDLLLRYMHTLLVQVAQSAACTSFHTVEERLCRWLLISRDRLHSEHIHLTQEFLSYMMGVSRTSVTAIAGGLQRKGLISYSRGKIKILDAPRMEASACECYAIIKEGLGHFLAA